MVCAALKRNSNANLFFLCTHVKSASGVPFSLPVLCVCVCVCVAWGRSVLVSYFASPSCIDFAQSSTRLSLSLLYKLPILVEHMEGSATIRCANLGCNSSSAYTPNEQNTDSFMHLTNALLMHLINALLIHLTTQFWCKVWSGKRPMSFLYDTSISFFIMFLLVCRSLTWCMFPCIVVKTC